MSFVRNLFTVSGFTLLSRIAGFIRDTLTATFLGAGFQADAFFVAQRLPNLFRSLFAEGAFSAAFVPLYTEEKELRGEEAAKTFAAEALAMLIAILIPFSLVIMLCMTWVIQIMAPGFNDDPEKFRLAVHYSIITFPYLLLISITALQSGVLNANGRFAPGAAAPIMLNIVLILALYLTTIFNWEVGETLAWATTISGGVQALWLAISCYNAKATIRLILPHFTDACKRLFRRVGPGAIGAGAAQVNLLLTTILASLLPTGAVSYLYYADRLNQLPLGIIGIAVATTLLPILSKHESIGEDDKVRHYVARAIEFCLIFGLPSFVGLAIASEPIIQTLFEHGAFTHDDTVKTAETLSAYAFCIPAFLLAKVFSARFFSMQDTKTPVKIAVLSMGLNVLIAIILLKPLEHVGMAVAMSLSTWVNVGLLFYSLKKRGQFHSDTLLQKRLPRILISVFVLAGVTWLTTLYTTQFFAESSILSHIIGLLIIIGLSSIAYAVLLQATKAVNVKEMTKYCQTDKEQA